ncbi:hypothetical protein Rleg2_5766 (plasmid) [Rhizobium leguminosarum bv. trifolii WSM2304]|uniref:Uncharacterized protein n=1 Tax=Rhizobium leguminosarum bv. trifolii (strain WSM2304) TaxID=395492 RepID=A0ABF7QXQ7_RHILW|nr:hypothetical protein [Rhizobium leguminosarum]ACI58939.1 hypothetical protein Rleg2_5766 [Rhizobium leguminosarum bv. trifolii WSM2304]
MFRNKLVAAFCAVVTLPAPAFATDSTQMISTLERFNDGSGAQQLAIKLAGLVEKADWPGLNALSKQIQDEDGPLLSELAGVGELGEAEQRKIALAMRPCQTANVLIRAIAIAIGDGRFQPIVRGGTVMIDGTEVDSNFAKHMWTCEVLGQLPHKTSIGSKCLMTGACKDDPDL